jgi:HEAT repeats/PBS lyase HEAT-like repeat
MGKRARLSTNKRRSSGVEDRQTLAVVLKWVGGATAVLSLVFGLFQLVQIVGTIRAQQHQVAELLRVGELQQAARDYSSAWASFAEAAKTAEAGGEVAKLTGSLSEDQRRTRKAEEDLAMAWLDDIHVSKDTMLSDIADRATPVLDRGVASSSGVRKADLLAHIGWANFLRLQSGTFDLDIEAKYRDALESDPSNPFAHAMWGHWLIVNGNHLKEAQQHFAAAFKSGRERPIVRKLQIEALEWSSEGEDKIELIRVCNEMRKNDEALSEEERIQILSHTDFLYKDMLLSQLAQILPPDEQLATYRWLLRGFDAAQSNYRSFALARLAEAAGDCGTAQRLYALLLGTTMLSEVRAGLDRCKQSSPHLKSTAELLTELLNDGSADVRRNVVNGFRALLADNDKTLGPEVILLALGDRDGTVRDAAADALATFPRQSLPALIQMLSSADSFDQARAAQVVGRIGVQAKAAVPALIAVLSGSPDEPHMAVVKALGSIGPDASSAVPALMRMFRGKPDIERQTTLIYAFGEIGSASIPAVPLLIEALSDPRDSSQFLNVSAAEALGKIGPGAKAAVPALIVALNSDTGTGRLVTIATGALGDIGADAKAAIPALVEAMSHEDPEYKKNQADAIGRIAQALAAHRDRASLGALRAALRAEEDAGLPLTTTAPLREAVHSLEIKGR